MVKVNLLSQLKHDNVVHLESYFFNIDKTCLVLVLEFCECGDLFTEISRRRSLRALFDEHYIWSVLRQICSGLKHLHENGIIHRDIKTSNIFMAQNFTVAKVGDLGVSRQLDKSTHMLRTLCGTPLYLPPELLDNKPYNEKADMWSLGIVLHELCALQAPFAASSLPELTALVRSGHRKPIPKRYSRALQLMIQWLLQREPVKRPSISQFLHRVEECLRTYSMIAQHNSAKVGTPDTSSCRPSPVRDISIAPSDLDEGIVDTDDGDNRTASTISVDSLDGAEIVRISPSDPRSSSPRSPIDIDPHSTTVPIKNDRQSDRASSDETRPLQSNNIMKLPRPNPADLVEDARKHLQYGARQHAPISTRCGSKILDAVVVTEDSQGDGRAPKTQQHLKIRQQLQPPGRCSSASNVPSADENDKRTANNIPEGKDEIASVDRARVEVMIRRTMSHLNQLRHTLSLMLAGDKHEHADKYHLELQFLCERSTFLEAALTTGRASRAEALRLKLTDVFGRAFGSAVNEKNQLNSKTSDHAGCRRSTERPGHTPVPVPVLATAPITDSPSRGLHSSLSLRLSKDVRGAQGVGTSNTVIEKRSGIFNPAPPMYASSDHRTLPSHHISAGDAVSPCHRRDHDGQSALRHNASEKQYYSQTEFVSRPSSAPARRNRRCN